MKRDLLTPANKYFIRYLSVCAPILAYLLSYNACPIANHYIGQFLFPLIFALFTLQEIENNKKGVSKRIQFLFFGTRWSCVHESQQQWNIKMLRGSSKYNSCPDVYFNKSIPVSNELNGYHSRNRKIIVWLFVTYTHHTHAHSPCD